VLGLDVIGEKSEDGRAQFFKSPKERGLSGVKLVISDAHAGLRAAVCKRPNPMALAANRRRWSSLKTHSAPAQLLA